MAEEAIVDEIVPRPGSKLAGQNVDPDRLAVEAEGDGNGGLEALTSGQSRFGVSDPEQDPLASRSLESDRPRQRSYAQVRKGAVVDAAARIRRQCDVRRCRLAGTYGHAQAVDVADVGCGRARYREQCAGGKHHRSKPRRFHGNPPLEPARSGASGHPGATYAGPEHRSTMRRQTEPISRTAPARMVSLQADQIQGTPTAI